MKSPTSIHLVMLVFALSVFGPDGNASEFAHSLKTLKDADDRCDAATVLTFNVPSGGSLTQYIDTADFYKYTTGSSATYRVTATSVQGIDIMLSLYDTCTLGIAQDFIESTEPGPSVRLVFYSAIQNDLYFQVYGTESCNYTIEIEFEPTPTPTPTSTPTPTRWPTHTPSPSDDTCTGANYIYEATPVQGELSQQDPEDWYKFVGEFYPDHEYMATLTSPPGANFDIYIYNVCSNGTASEVMGWSITTTQVEHLLFTVDSGDHVFILIDRVSGSGTYTLSVGQPFTPTPSSTPTRTPTSTATPTRTPTPTITPTPYDDICGDAELLIYATPYHGTLDNTDTTDWFNYISGFPSAHDFTITLESPVGANFDLCVYDGCLGSSPQDLFACAESTSQTDMLTLYITGGNLIHLNVYQVNGTGPYTLSIIQTTPIPTPTPSTGYVVKPILIGWNSFGISKEPMSSVNASSLLNAMLAQSIGVTHAASWSGTSWQIFQRGMPFNNFDLELCQGYFVRSLTTGDFTYQGYEVSSPCSFTFSTGWNFISLPYLTTSYTASTLMATINNAGCTATHCARWLGSSWQIYQVNLPFNDFGIETDTAYFVRVLQGCECTP